MLVICDLNNVAALDLQTVAISFLEYNTMYSMLLPANPPVQPLNMEMLGQPAIATLMNQQQELILEPN